AYSRGEQFQPLLAAQDCFAHLQLDFQLNSLSSSAGAIYLHECPRQHYIPIYLIGLGLSSLLFVLLSCFPCAKEPEEGTSNPLSTIYKAWNLLSMFFVFCWFIAGDVWIYSIYQPNYDKNTTNVDPYCNKTLYLFAFWINTLVNISFGFVFLGGFLFLLGFCLYKGVNPAADITDV
uniref:Si:dkey-19b23.12 n=1 Tax=Neolamprologus brichardi TaxID=32507 RepID=A0A3Q4N4D5_NEOBR